MAYQASYRAWRPQKFAQVVGQERTVTALKNAVASSQVAHAYLFSGPRGTGKTSVAKILAKAVNCPHQEGGEPCDQCLSCQEIREGSFMDVIEIDAASNRGIDQIRDLREQVRVMPAQGKKKVYIIDEAHMLTQEASNALLKTLEEPPESVIFILATTEADRLLPTILSRCQRYTFRRLSETEIRNRLQEVAEERQVECEEAALNLIARRSFGGLRDALSFFDQALAGGKTRLDKEYVLSILGMVGDDWLQDLFDALLDRETAAVIRQLDQALAAGRETGRLAGQITAYLRDLLVYGALGEQADLAAVDVGHRGRLAEQSKRTTYEALLQGWELMNRASEEMRHSETQRYQLELALLQMSSLLAPRTARRQEAVAVKAETASTPAPDREQLNWNQVVDQVKAHKVTVSALLAPARLVGVQDNLVVVGYRKGFKFHRERMMEKENRELLESVLKEMLGRPVEVSFISLDDTPEEDPLVKKAIEIFGADRVKIKND